ncbi:MAG: polymerase subunit gamma/tau [Pseudothermotoga sp.]|nr:polymerase subunit gamma/tau [Pseudothermotoga sp.]
MSAVKEILERLKSFLQINVGSSVCVRSREQSLLKRVRNVVAELTKEYLIFTEPSIDEVRQAEEFLYTASNDGVKAVVFEKFERSSIEAMNAFLKTLEEPPSHSLVVLTSVKFRELPQTIRSRVKVFDFFVPVSFYEDLKGRISLEPELLLRLCKADFDVAEYVNEVSGEIEAVHFEPSSFLSLFKGEELRPYEKVQALLALNDLFTRFKNGEFNDKRFVELYTTMVEQAKKLELNRVILQISWLCEIVLEHRGVNDLSVYRWFDSILRNRLLNFNSQLTFANLLIKFRRCARR